MSFEDCRLCWAQARTCGAFGSESGPTDSSHGPREHSRTRHAGGGIRNDFDREEGWAGDVARRQCVRRRALWAEGSDAAG